MELLRVDFMAKFGDSSGLLWSNVGRSEKAGLYLTRTSGRLWRQPVAESLESKSGLLFETCNGMLHLHNKVEKSVADSTAEENDDRSAGKGMGCLPPLP